MRATILALLVFGALRAADPAIPVAKIPPPPELYLMLPEPRAMRSAISRVHAGAQRTVFTPARQTDDGKVRGCTKEEFARLGISWETFLGRAQAAADRRLAALQPELKKDNAGRVLYAVYRGEEPLFACLLIAPALAEVLRKTFGDEIWLIAPDRNSLFIFPARSEAIAEFAEDLKERFDDNPYAASDEVFALKSGGEGLRAVGSFRSVR